MRRKLIRDITIATDDGEHSFLSGCIINIGVTKTFNFNKYFVKRSGKRLYITRNTKNYILGNSI